MTVLELAQSGDPEAFAQLVAPHRAKLSATIRRWLPNPADAEEELERGLWNAYRGLPTFAGNSQLSTWLTRIVINAALERYRSDRRSSVEVQSQIPERPDRSPSPERWAESAEFCQRLEGLIPNLPPIVRTAWILADVYGCTAKEIAKALNIGAYAARARIHRARLLLRASLQEVR